MVRAVLLLVLLAVLAALTDAKPLEPCPSPCRCYLSEGLKRADCRHVPEWADQQSDAQDVRIQPPAAGRGSRSSALFLTHFEVFPKVLQLAVTNRSVAELLPSGFHGLHSLQELDLSYNLLSRFNYKVFLRMPALRRLVLHGNPIVLEANVPLITSRSLLSLDLSYCDIVDVPRGSLEGMRNLSSLSLSNNPIHLEAGKPLLPIKTIVDLDLSNCELTAVPAGSLDGLVNLRRLYLDGNNLHVVQKGVLPRGLHLLDLSANQIRDAPTAVVSSLRNLSRLELSDNPITCTCALIGLQGWLSRRLVVTDKPVVCAEPAKYRGLSWTKVNELELCQAEESSTTSDSESSDESSESSDPATDETAESSQPASMEAMELPPASYEVYTHENIIKHHEPMPRAPAIALPPVLELKTLNLHANNEINFIQGDQPYDHIVHDGDAAETTTAQPIESMEVDGEEEGGDASSEAPVEENEGTEKDAEVFMRNADTIAMGRSMPEGGHEPEAAVNTATSTEEPEHEETENEEKEHEETEHEETEHEETEHEDAEHEDAEHGAGSVAPNSAEHVEEENAAGGPAEPEHVTKEPESPDGVPTQSTETTLSEGEHNDNHEPVAPVATTPASKSESEEDRAGHERALGGSDEDLGSDGAEELSKSVEEEGAAVEVTTPVASIGHQEADHVTSTPAPVPVVEEEVHAEVAKNIVGTEEGDEEPKAEDTDTVPASTPEGATPVSETVPEPQHKAEVESVPESAPESTPEAVAETEREPPAGIVPEVLPESVPDVTPEPAPVTPEPAPVTPEPAPVTPEVVDEAVPEAASESVPAMVPEVVPESVPEATPEVIHESAPAVTPESAPEVKTEMAPEHHQPTPDLPEERTVGAVMPGQSPDAKDDVEGLGVNAIVGSKRNEELAVEQVPTSPEGQDTEDVQKSTLTYIILGCIVVAMVVLILYALLRSKAKKADKPVRIRRDNENPGTEMKDMMNPLLEPAPEHSEHRRGSLVSLELIQEVEEDVSSAGQEPQQQQGAILDDKKDGVLAAKGAKGAKGATGAKAALEADKDAVTQPNGKKVANGKSKTPAASAPPPASPATPASEASSVGVVTQPSRVKVKAGVISTPEPRTPVLVNHRTNGSVKLNGLST